LVVDAKSKSGDKLVVDAKCESGDKLVMDAKCEYGDNLVGTRSVKPGMSWSSGEL